MRVLQATSESLKEAGRIIREGGLVILPTETVYGLAANALDEAAICRLYQVKRRPLENPLIVHVSSVQQAQELALEWPREAELLAEREWPGPLTLVVKRKPVIPDVTCAGLDTVALRMPNHPVALDVIQYAGVPVAAPSANPFTRLSATRVEHLDPDLAEAVDLVIDGGPCSIGLESTVIDVTAFPPRILRPGGVSRASIQAALKVVPGSVPPNGIRRSPGQYPRHYAPQAKVVLVDVLEPDQTGLTFDQPTTSKQIKMPLDPAAYGAAMYDALHKLDAEQPPEIFVERPPEEPSWEAVWDRLEKASAANSH